MIEVIGQLAEAFVTLAFICALSGGLVALIALACGADDGVDDD